MASGNRNSWEKDGKTVDEKLDENLRMLKVITKNELRIFFYYSQKEIKKVDEENKGYETGNRKIESEISEVKKASDVVKKSV